LIKNIMLHKNIFSVCDPTFYRAERLNELLLNLEKNINDKNKY